MECLRVKGGTPLKGTIEVSGSKNAVLPIMAACVLAGGISVIKGVPRLRDVDTMQEVLERVGAVVTRQGNQLVIDTRRIDNFEVPADLTRRMRASNLLLGPLLGRLGKIKIFRPGGCNIGSRPMDLHIKGLVALGARMEEKAGYIMAEVEALRGAEIHLDVPSVGATENIMMAAVFARGTTVIRNAAREPEIVDLQNFLNCLGADIKGAGTSTIRIRGVGGLSSCSYTVIPDRIEAGTHMVAAAITGGEVEIKNVIPEHIEPVIAKLKECGVEVVSGDDRVYVRAKGRPTAVNIKTMPYPGFPTDMQPQFMALLALADGTSVITETIFENRFKHVNELNRMGADIRVEGRVAIVRGVSRLVGATVEATDLRAGAALVLAALAAEGETLIERADHIDRGYEQIEEKYRRVGAKIERVAMEGEQIAGSGRRPQRTADRAAGGA